MEALLDLHELLEKSKALANEEKIAIDGLMRLRLSSDLLWQNSKQTL